MLGDMDVVVLGSKNGLGKTSVLEACVLLFLAATNKEILLRPSPSDIPLNLSDLLIRAGTQVAKIDGELTYKKKASPISLSLHSNGKAETENGHLPLREIMRDHPRYPREIEDIIFSLIGLDPEPLILPPLIYFHSYRKVSEGKVEFGAMVDSRRYYPRGYRSAPRYLPISTFKLSVIRAMMGRVGLFDRFEEVGADEVLDTINKLMKQYVGGYIEKLRPSPDNTLEFRVTPTNGGPSFNFDGLSSGQKEIISTLFLVWEYTRKHPGIVLIDEPELHLNPEWQRAFIRSLHEIAPHNQYIIATHSEDIFASVEPDRRILLEVQPEARR
jgi:hypothetical protein